MSKHYDDANKVYDAWKILTAERPTELYQKNQTKRGYFESSTIKEMRIAGVAVVYLVHARYTPPFAQESL